MMLNLKQQKVAQAELRALKEAFGGRLDAVKDAISKRERLEREIADNATPSSSGKRRPCGFEYGFIDEGDGQPGTLTPRGRACAAFADGQPLICGTIISDGWLDQLSAAEICQDLHVPQGQPRGGFAHRVGAAAADAAKFEEVPCDGRARGDPRVQLNARHADDARLVTHRGPHIATWIDLDARTFVKASRATSTSFARSALPADVRGTTSSTTIWT